MIGQAITGHPNPNDFMAVLQGSGENGKSAITTDGLVPALGDYASMASTKLFQSSSSEHSTERAELRGKRLVIAEELTCDAWNVKLSCRMNRAVIVPTPMICLRNQSDQHDAIVTWAVEGSILYHADVDTALQPTERIRHAGVACRS